jgi:hypothetical protein
LVDEESILMFDAVELLHDLAVLVIDGEVVGRGDLRNTALEVEAQLALLGLAHLGADVFNLDGRVFYDVLGS